MTPVAANGPGRVERWSVATRALPPRENLVNAVATPCDISSVATDVKDCLTSGPIADMGRSLLAVGAIGGAGLVAHGLSSALKSTSLDDSLDASCEVYGGIECMGYLGQEFGAFSTYEREISNFGMLAGTLQAATGIREISRGEAASGSVRCAAGVTWFLASSQFLPQVTAPLSVCLNLAVLAVDHVDGLLHSADAAFRGMMKIADPPVDPRCQPVFNPL